MRFLARFAILGLTLSSLTGAQVKIGERIEHTFSNPPVGSMGVKSLEELVGKPVLIEFWGTH